MIINTLKHITLILVLFVFQNIKAETKDQRIKVALRTISHEFLLQVNDSTSRILPIETIDGRYVVRFENEFSFEPDLLLFAVYKVYEHKDIQENFIVEVEECKTKALVHSFQVSQVFEKSMAPCKMRGLPKNCYVFYFTEIEVDKALPQKEVLYIDNTNTPVHSGEKSTSTYVLSALVLAIGGGGFYYLKSKHTNNETESVASVPSHYISIGKYVFDKRGMTLLLDEVSVELSAKETDLLDLLLTHENQTLEREFILNQVWKDEGSYVGRTLDVFISKLRKKLTDDSNIKIINVRGVGYRFIIQDPANG